MQLGGSILSYCQGHRCHWNTESGDRVHGSSQVESSMGASKIVP